MESDQHRVVLGPARKLLKPEEIAVFSFDRSVRQDLIGVVVGQVGGPRHSGHAREVGVHAGLRHGQEDRAGAHQFWYAAAFFQAAFAAAEQSGIEQQKDASHQKTGVCKSVVRRHLFTEQQEEEGTRKHGAEHAPRDVLYVQESLKAHGEQQQDVQKGLSGGQRVGIIHAVPYEVQHVRREADQQEGEQQQFGSLLPPGDLFLQDIQRQQDKDKDAAVNVGPVVEPGLDSHVKAMPREHVENREINFDLTREIDVAEFGKAQRGELWQQQDSRHAARKQGKYTETDQRFPVKAGDAVKPRKSEGGGILFRGRLPRDQQDREIEHEKQTQHNGQIIV